MTLDELAADIARRKAAYEARTGQPLVMPRNAGNRRTESKEALLAVIDELAAKKGFRW
jgi:hypothetical protein